MAEHRPVRFTPEWVWWLLFGANALFALWFATEGGMPLMAVFSAFFAGLALTQATFGPRLRRIEQMDEELARHLRSLGIDVEAQRR